MGLVIRLHSIVSPNSYTISVKEGNNPYPLDSGYTNVTGTMVNGVFTITSQHYKFNTQYFVKLTDITTGRYIIENIYENDPIAYMGCAPQPIGMVLECTHDYYPPENLSAICPPDATPTPTPTPTNTPLPNTNTPLPNTNTPIPPTFTPLPSGVTPDYYVVRRCDNSVTDLLVNNPTDFLELNKSYTLTGSHPQMNGILCWEVTAIVHTGTPAYDVSYDQRYNSCSACTVTYFDAYTGSSLSVACAQTNSHRIWYHGSLGVDTVLYNDSSVSVPVDFGFYYYNTDVVLEVGHPSVEDGRVTVNHTCSELPTPTPTPMPQGYFTGYVSDGTATEACLGGIFGPIGQTPYYAFAFDTQGSTQDNLCDATYITTENYGYNGDIIKPMAQGGKYDMNPDFYIASGGYVRQWRRTGNTSHATPISSCTSCSGGATPTPIPNTNTPIPNTPTPIPLGTQFTAYYGTLGTSGTGTACSGANSVTLYPAYGASSNLNNGQQYYYSNGSPFDGSNYPSISDAANTYGTMGSDGIYHAVGNCD